jgi:hypothetical protein
MKEDEIVMFIESLLDMSIPKNKQFFNELMERVAAPALDTDIKVGVFERNRILLGS